MLSLRAASHTQLAASHKALVWLKGAPVIKPSLLLWLGRTLGISYSSFEIKERDNREREHTFGSEPNKLLVWCARNKCVRSRQTKALRSCFILSITLRCPASRVSKKSGCPSARTKNKFRAWPEKSNKIQQRDTQNKHFTLDAAHKRSASAITKTRLQHAACPCDRQKRSVCTGSSACLPWRCWNRPRAG